MLIPFWKKNIVHDQGFGRLSPQASLKVLKLQLCKVYLEKANVELLQAYWRLHGTFPVEDGIDTIRYEMLF